MRNEVVMRGVRSDLGAIWFSDDPASDGVVNNHIINDSTPIGGVTIIWSGLKHVPFIITHPIVPDAAITVSASAIPVCDPIIECINDLDGEDLLHFPLTLKTNVLIRFTLKEAIDQTILTVGLSSFNLTIGCHSNGDLPSGTSFTMKRLGALSTQFSEERDWIPDCTVLCCSRQRDGAAIPFPAMLLTGNRVPSVATILCSAFDAVQWGAGLMCGVVIGMSAHA